MTLKTQNRMKTLSISSLTHRKVRDIFLCFAVFLAMSIGSAKAATLTFAIGATNGVTNSQVVVPVRASNFVNVSSFQFSFHWNSAVASFVKVEELGGLAGITTNNFGLTFISTGTLTVAWDDLDGTSKTVPDGTTLFGVRLQLIGPPATTSPVTIDDIPTPVVAGDQNFMEIPVVLVNSTLSIDRTLVVACSPDKTVECGTLWNFDPPAATDSCSGLPVAINVLSSVTNATSCGFIATRVWEIVDQCNNRTTCAQIVTAIDTTPPTPIPAPNKIIEYGQFWGFDAPTGTDSCSGVASIQVLVAITNAGPCGPTYSATCMWELTDGCGNKTNCSQTVTVRDSTPPSLTATPDKNINCLAPWSFDEPSAVDLADGVIIPTIISSVTNGVCASGFTATRTWLATDSCGNSSTRMQRVFGRAIVAVSGTVFNPTNYPATPSEKRLVGATVLGPTNASGTTVADGSYNLIFDAANDVVLKAMPPAVGNPADGVTALDIAFIRRQILSIASLDSPYKLLAADVDGNAKVSTLDLTFIRRLVLDPRISHPRVRGGLCRRVTCLQIRCYRGALRRTALIPVWERI